MQLLIFLLLFISHTRASYLCDNLMQSELNSPAEKFVNFLQHINESNLLTLENWIELHQRFINANPINPFGNKTLSKQNSVYERIFEDYIEDEETYSSKIVLNWIEEKIQNSKREAGQQKKISAKTKYFYADIIKGELPPGEVYRDAKLGNTGIVAITHGLEVMTTPVTNAQWYSVFYNGVENIPEGLINLETEGFPRVQTTYSSKIAFANKLSELHGFEPVYDKVENFDDLIEEDEEAVLGNLGHGEGNELSVNLYRLNRNESFYKRNGYRLPTYDEQTYLFYKGLEANNRTIQSNLNEFAVFNQEKVSRVATKRSFKINGIKYFDIIGNVSETSQFSFKERGACFVSTSDPAKPYVTKYLNTSPPPICGMMSLGRFAGSYFDRSILMLNGEVELNQLNEQTGFRLVRTLK